MEQKIIQESWSKVCRGEVIEEISPAFVGKMTANAKTSPYDSVRFRAKTAETASKLPINSDSRKTQVAIGAQTKDSAEVTNGKKSYSEQRFKRPFANAGQVKSIMFPSK